MRGVAPGIAKHIGERVAKIGALIDNESDGFAERFSASASNNDDGEFPPAVRTSSSDRNSDDSACLDMLAAKNLFLLSIPEDSDTGNTPSVADKTRNTLSLNEVDKEFWEPSAPPSAAHPLQSRAAVETSSKVSCTPCEFIDHRVETPFLTELREKLMDGLPHFAL